MPTIGCMGETLVIATAPFSPNPRANASAVAASAFELASFLVFRHHGGMGEHSTRLWHRVREQASHWMAGGVIVALTGLAPEEWLGHAAHRLHIPDSVLHLWSTGVDVRVVPITLGVTVVAIALIRQKRALPVPAGGSAVTAMPRVEPEPAAALPLPDRPSIAVLPFANLSGDPEQDYLADGMVEEITTALSRVRWFFVIARNSSFTYKGRAVDVKQVGRELGVRYALEGSVRKAGERVRITAQLVETDAGVHVWADRFDGVIENIFDLQDEITASVVGAIEPQLRDAELSRAKRQRPTNPTAYDCFLRGMSRYYSASREENDATMRLLRGAIASDPDFAPPYGLAAACCVHRVAQGWSEDSRGDRQLGIEMARTAARLGTGDPTVLALAGHSLGYLTDEYDLSLSLTEHALALNPNSTIALQLGGWAHLYAGDPDVAMVYFLRGTRLNPIDTKRFILDSGMARACLMLGRYEEAVGWARKSLAGAPHWIFGSAPLAGALAMLGRSEEAAAAVAHLLAGIPRYSVAREIRRHKPSPACEALAVALRVAGFPP
jgi:adenylate cyclase